LPKDAAEQQKLMWGKDCDVHLKKQDRCEENKAKAFAFILGQCDEGMKNKLQSDSAHETIDDTFDVISLLKLMKDAMCNAHDKKSPALQAVAAWKQLMMASQKEHESLLNYYKRFQSLVERVELLCGDIEPKRVAARDPKYAKSKSQAAMIEKEKGEMLAIAFMEGANKCFKPLLNDLEQDYSLGDDKYPNTVEEALQVLSMYEQQTLKRMVKKQPKNDDDAPLNLSFAQQKEMKKNGLCFKCGKHGHVMKDCPQNDTTSTDDAIPEQTHTQQAWTVDNPPRGWAG